MRIADEVCLQMHLLDLSFQLAVRARADSEEQAAEICRQQLVGIAGIAAERLHRALDLPADEAGALRTLSLHPLLNPAAYVDAAVGTDGVRVQHGPAHDDGAWIARCGPDAVTPLQAVVRAVDPALDVEVEGDRRRLVPAGRPWRAGERGRRGGGDPVQHRQQRSPSSRAGRSRSRRSEAGAR